MPAPSNPIPSYHPALHAAAIAAMALTLTLGLHILNFTQSLNALLIKWMTQLGLAPFPHSIPPLALWATASILAFALSFAIICTPTYPRKIILFLSSLFLTFSSTFVAALAMFQPDLAPILLVCSWAGLCSIFHRTPHLSQHANAPQPVP